MAVTNRLQDQREIREELSLEPFKQADQERFARLSRDFNPVHLDSLAARRTLFGQPIVHGVHLILRALETASRLPSEAAYSRIHARFHRPVFLEEPLILQLRKGVSSLDLAYTIEGTQLATIRLSAQATFDDLEWSAAIDQCRSVPRALAIDDIPGCDHKINLPQDPAEIRSLFPNASKAYGTNRIANILGVTYVIGMEAPGLHSMLATLSIELLNRTGTALHFWAKRVSPKISLIKLHFDSDALRGSADAFVRPQVGAIDFQTLRKAVVEREFSGRRALVVGGSRGLGLLTANLLGAGGAEVVLTYRSGEAEAKNAVDTLQRNGVVARAARLDVSRPDETFSQFRRLGVCVTDMFYFATPHIFVRKKQFSEDKLLRSFLEIYVNCFLNVVEETKRLAQGHLSILFPSSEVLNSPLKDLAEYYISKAAGEAACEMLNRYDNFVTVTVARLPRLPTDQTANLINVPTEDPVRVLLGICRAMGTRTS